MVGGSVQNDRIGPRQVICNEKKSCAEFHITSRKITGELARSINLLSLAAGLNSGGELCEELAAQVCSIYNSSLSKISTWKIYLWTLSGGARVILERSQVFPNTA
jgi:hypothetical protein